MLTRRTFIAATAGLGAAALGGRTLLRAAKAAEPQPLRIPELIDARSQGQSIALRVQRGRTAFFPGRPTPTLGYNGSYLGPTLRLHRGDEVEVAVTNALAEDTTVHWHGLLIPGHLDGGPHQPIRPGATWRPVLPVRQPAATLLYHSHVHGRTAEQVYSGLAGLLLIADDEERALGLPSEYGVDDLPLVLQDRAFTTEGELVYPGGPMAMMHGARGGAILVNGTPNPVARVPARLVRLRLANAANARIFELSFDDSRVFHRVASDAGLLEGPVAQRALLLAPGERAEILVDFSDGRPVALLTGPDRNSPMMGMGMMARFEGDSGGAGPVLRFEPGAPAGVGGAAVPERLVARERLNPAQAVRRRRLVLNMGMGGMGMGGRMGTMMGPGMMGRGMGMGGMMRLGIDGRPFAMERIDQRVRLGDVEIWEVAGEMMAHPFHIHGVHFEVLGGGADQGAKDTVLVREPVELLVRFTQPAPEAPFMYHCHILEHEDNGMMGQFVVA